MLAWRVGQSCLPRHASKFSRHDFTLPQLFACLTLRQFSNVSYRKNEALLGDSPSWRRAIGLEKTPDHNTLRDAFDVVVQVEPSGKTLDLLADAFEDAGLLQLDRKALAVDSSYYESRHFERRKREGKSDEAAKSERSATVKKLPKMAVAVAASCHLILAAWATTGAGADHPHSP